MKDKGNVFLSDMNYMSETKKTVAVICEVETFKDIETSLSSEKYNFLFFRFNENPVSSKDLIDVKVAIIDVDTGDVQCFDTIKDIQKDHPSLRVVLIGDFRKTVFPEDVPKIFYFIRKPFSPEKIEKVMEKAFNIEYGHERRREPRIPIKLPVELYYNTKFWKTLTTNLSLHGMQAIWTEDKYLHDISEKHSQGISPISALRLFTAKLEVEDEDHINVPVILRYIAFAEEEGRATLMGFEFGDLDLDLRAKLQELIVV